jgi:phosphonoacetate hydrolase
MISRLLISTLVFFVSAAFLRSQREEPEAPPAGQRLIIVMFDGFGMSYYKNAPMPYLKQLAAKGFFKPVKALMPTVTNANNASICCGTFPEENGITGNSFLADNDQEEYMENSELLLSPTIFEKLKKQGIRSALISSKKKSIALLSRGAEIALSPETADSSWIRRFGKPPGIYSPEVNYWTMKTAISVLKERPDIGCLYIHTTDYPMHTWAPGDSSSLKHLAEMDNYLRQIAEAAPDAMILITADHDVNHKNRCVDLDQSLAAKQVKIKIAISAERDKYLKHHRGFGGTSFVYLQEKKSEAQVKKALLSLKGVKSVITRQEAAKRYHLMPARIGDLVVLADSLTVFGNLDPSKTEETLPPAYRTHGSEYEQNVPLFIFNAKRQLPPPSFFQYNKDLTAWLIKRP